MKVLVVQDADWFKKGPHQQHHLMEMMSLKDHEIVVIGFDQLWNGTNGIISRTEKYYNVSRFYEGSRLTYVKPFFIKLPLLDYTSYLFSSRSTIEKFVNDFQPDVIIGFTSVISNYWGMYYARKKGIPFVYYWTDIIHALVPLKTLRPLAKFIEKNIIKNSTIILCINEVLKDQVLELGADESITKVLTGGIDFNKFNLSKIDAKKIRKINGLSDDDIVLLFMGWIYDFSGLKEIIIELSKRRNSKIKLMIVGEGDAFIEVKQTVTMFNMENSIIMTGHRPYDEMPSFISAADICLLPAYNNDIMKDIVPIKIYEYLAMHKPVISTRLQGVIKEFGFDNGVLYVDKPEDVINFVENLSKDSISANIENARNFIVNYGWGEIITDFIDILEDITDKSLIDSNKTKRV